MNRRQRKKMSRNIEVIGIDHGWSLMKTSNDIFTSGVSRMINRPVFYDNTLKYRDDYYQIGIERMEVRDTKTENDSYYILTLAAIAKELRRREMREAEIAISAGLPLTRFSEEKEDFINYLMREKEVGFEYKQVPYRIKLSKVYLYPQCYAAVVNLIPTFGEQVLAVDVGSWTVDIMPIISRKPYDSGCNTINEGIIRCMNEIKKKSIRGRNGKLDERHIQQYMTTGHTELGEFYKNLMESEVRAFAARIFDYIREDGYSTELMPVVFVGGGASVIQRFGSYNGNKMTFVNDIRANARGYETLAGIALRKGM